MLDNSLINEANALNDKAREQIRKLELECDERARELEAANELLKNTDKSDARENADLQLARESQARANHNYNMTQRRLMALKGCVENYKPMGVITLGTTMELTCLSVNNQKQPSGEPSRFVVKLVEHDASDAASGFIATDCKVGVASLGKTAGDTILVSTPRGTIQYRIERIY